MTAAPVSSSFVIASLFFMLGFVLGALVGESRGRRRRRKRRPSSSPFAGYYPDDYDRPRTRAEKAKVGEPEGKVHIEP